MLSLLLLSSFATAANPCRALKTTQDMMGTERSVVLSEGGAGLVILRERQGVITLTAGLGLNRGLAAVSTGTDITLPAGTKVEFSTAQGATVEFLSSKDTPPKMKALDSVMYALWAVELAPTKEQLAALGATPTSYRAQVDGNLVAISLRKENQRALADASTCLANGG